MSEAKELNILVGVLGENFEQCNLIGQALGAPGSKSDLLFYNRRRILRTDFCAITPIGYPDKIKPFLQTMMITSVHILVVDLEIVSMQSSVKSWLQWSYSINSIKQNLS